MKTVFIVSVAAGYGGAERSVEIILRHLPADVRAWVFAHNAEHVERLEQAMPPQARLVRLGQTRTLLGKRRAALRLWRALRQHRPDAVLVNTHASALLAGMVAKWEPQLGRRCYLYVRDFLWTDLPYIFTRLAGCKVLLPTEAVAARHGYLSPWYIEPFGPNPWTVIPDMASLSMVSREGGSFFLHLATINPWKGHADLMLATGMLIEQGEMIRVRSAGMVADPPLLERLQKLRERLTPGEAFTFLPYQSDPSALLHDCRAVVLPSISHSGGPESFGRSIIEAWACAKPVIAYASGGPARLIRDGVDGLLVEEGNTAALAAAMSRLNNDPALAEQLGTAGYERVKKEFSPEQVVPALFKEMLDANKDGIVTAANANCYVLHDYMQVNGGAERLVMTTARALPNVRLAVSGIYPGFTSAARNGVNIEVWGRQLKGLPRVLRALLVFGLGSANLRDAAAVLYSGIFAPLAVKRQSHGRKIYYCHTPPRFAFDRQAEYLARLPTIVHPLFRWLISHYRRAYLSALQQMDLVLTNSAHVQDRLHEQTGSRAQVVYPPIDTARLRHLGQKNYYLSVARLEPNKRVNRILQAFLDLPEQQLVVTSGGSELAALKALAGDAPNIRFTDWLDDDTLAQLVGEATAIIYIPRDEDFGMSAVEAMAAGKPVIGVNEGGLRESIIDGETGLLLPADPSPQAIREAVQRMTGELAASMREACENRARAFSRERFLQTIKTIINPGTEV